MSNAAALSPGQQRPASFSIKGFRVTTQKLPILKAAEVDSMTQRLGIALPEMIFGGNFVAIEHEKSGWQISFNAYDALDRVDKTGRSMLQVAYSKEWQRSRYFYWQNAVCPLFLVPCANRQSIWR